MGPDPNDVGAVRWIGNQSLRPGLSPPDQEDGMKKLVRAQAGVKLGWIERLAGMQKDISFRLSTHRGPLWGQAE